MFAERPGAAARLAADVEANHTGACGESAVQMKPRSNPSAQSRRLAPEIAVLLGVAFLLTGCVSTGYLRASKDTPPPQSLDVPFAPGRLEAALNAVITYNGPGSWKRDAFWDEYVVTLRNPGSQVLTVSATGRTDFSGAVQTAGDNPWKLEKQSKTLEEKYRAAGITFARYTVPGVLIVGGATALAAATSGGGFLAGYAVAAGAAGATVVVLPVYYGTVLTINHFDKVRMEKEFTRRRIVLPISLAAGQTRTGSFFFPMVPSPRSLAFHWTAESGPGDSVLALGFLHDLHVKKADKPAATK
jgi:hypothetical protein